MKRCMVYVNCMLAFLLLQSCSSDHAIIRKEGCSDKNTLRIVVFLTESMVPSGTLNKDTVSKEALKIADERCRTIVSSAMAINKNHIVQYDNHVVSWKIVLVEREKDGYIVIVDYVLHDAIASLLQCR